jgi:hypothetical protein
VVMRLFFGDLEASGSFCDSVEVAMCSHESSEVARCSHDSRKFV